MNITDYTKLSLRIAGFKISKLFEFWMLYKKWCRTLDKNLLEKLNDYES